MGLSNVIVHVLIGEKRFFAFQSPKLIKFQNGIFELKPWFLTNMYFCWSTDFGNPEYFIMLLFLKSSYCLRWHSCCRCCCWLLYILAFSQIWPITPTLILYFNQLRYIEQAYLSLGIHSFNTFFVIALFKSHDVIKIYFTI